jgi:hypothetical protein
MMTTKQFQSIVSTIESKRQKISQSWIILLIITITMLPIWWLLNDLLEFFEITINGFNGSPLWGGIRIIGGWYQVSIIAMIAFTIYQYFHKNQAVHRMISEELYRPLFKHYFPQLTYSSYSDLKREDVQKLPLFGSVRFEGYQSEDSIKGMYKTLPIQIHEVNITYAIRSFDKKQIMTLFNGLIMQVHLPVATQSTTLVYSKGTNLHTNLHRIGEKVSLESKHFGELFSTYSTNQHEARLHLKTHFMARLIDFLWKHQDRKIHLAFLNDKLIVCIAQNYNLFQVTSMLTPVTLEEVHAQLLKDTNLIKILLDDLALKRI